MLAFTALDALLWAIAIIIVSPIIIFLLVLLFAAGMAGIALFIEWKDSRR